MKPLVGASTFLHLAGALKEFLHHIVARKDIEGKHSRPFVGEDAVLVHAIQAVRDNDTW